MEIGVSTQQGNVPVTILSPHGNLDASNYLALINTGRRLVMEGAQDFVIDLRDVAFMSSAGLMAIFSLALIMRGEELPDLEAGKAAVKSMRGSRAPEKHKHIKLLGPNEDVADTLEKVGFTEHFRIFSDLHEAVTSF